MRGKKDWRVVSDASPMWACDDTSRSITPDEWQRLENALSASMARDENWEADETGKLAFFQLIESTIRNWKWTRALLGEALWRCAKHPTSCACMYTRDDCSLRNTLWSMFERCKYFIRSLRPIFRPAIGMSKSACILYARRGSSYTQYSVAIPGFSKDYNYCASSSRQKCDFIWRFVKFEQVKYFIAIKVCPNYRLTKQQVLGEICVKSFDFGFVRRTLKSRNMLSAGNAWRICRAKEAFFLVT